MADLSSGTQWGPLVIQGRAKAHGVPWNEEELKAIYEKGMKPDDVRKGYLDPSELEKDQEIEKNTPVNIKALFKLTKAQLAEYAAENNIALREDMTRGEMISTISQA